MRKAMIDRFLARLGLKLVPVDHVPSDTTICPPAETSFHAFLQRQRARGFDIRTIIDVGASDGRWSESVMPLYPNAQCLCVEAQQGHEAALLDFVARYPRAEYAICAAGDREGEIFFDASDLFGGFASETAPASNGVRVPVQTIDTMVEARGLPPPYLIKLDTHGYELAILEGAARTLAHTELLVVEVYNFEIAPTAVRFADFCRFLAEQDFLCLDLFDPMYRPSDGALWQMDLAFARASRPEFQTHRYS